MRPAAINPKTSDISVSGSSKTSPSYLTSRNMAITALVIGLLGAVATILIWQLGLTSNWVTYTVAGVSGAFLIGSAIATMIHYYSKREITNSRTTKKLETQAAPALTHTSRPTNKPNPTATPKTASSSTPSQQMAIPSGAPPQTPQQSLIGSSALSPASNDEYVGYLEADDADNVLRLLQARENLPTSTDIHKMINKGADKCVRAVLEAYPTIEVQYVKSIQNEELRGFIEVHNANVPLAQRRENTQAAKLVVMEHCNNKGSFDELNNKGSFDELLTWLEGAANRDAIEIRDPLDRNPDNTVFNLLIINGFTIHLERLFKLMDSELVVTAEDIAFAEANALPSEKEAIIELLKAHQALAASNPGSRHGSLKPPKPQIVLQPLNTYSAKALQAMQRIPELAAKDTGKDELFGILQEHNIFPNERITDKTILQIAAEAGALINVTALVKALGTQKIPGLAHYIQNQPDLSHAIKKELEKVAA